MIKLLNELKAKDLIAFFVLAALFYTRFKGIDLEIDAIMGLILGYYFVKRQNGQDNGK